jgi:hypothetical protein
MTDTENLKRSIPSASESIGERRSYNRAPAREGGAASSEIAPSREGTAELWRVHKGAP